MTRMVFCKRLKQELPGLEAPPFPGAKGIEVFEHVSVQAWQQWQNMQTMLINEKALNMMDKESRKYLNNQRDMFLAGEETDQADGYIAPEN